MTVSGPEFRSRKMKPRLMTSERRDPAYQDILDASGSKAAGFAQQILATTAPFLAKPAASLDVLDLGCSYGHTAIELARHVRHVVGMEPSVSLHEGGRKLVAEQGLRNVELRRAGIDRRVKCRASGSFSHAR